MIKRYFTLLCTVVLATGAAHAQKIAVSKGLKLELVSNMKMTMTMEMMGQNIDNSTETSNTTQIELKEVNPANYLFSNTVTKMLMHTSAAGQEMSFDSDKKEDLDGPMGAGMKNVLNTPQEIVVDKQGRIMEKKGDTATGGFTDMMNMGGLLKGQPYPVLATLPGHPVKVGESWTDSTGSPASFKAVTTYTVKGISKDEVLLDFTSQVAKKGTMEQQGMQIDLDMTGTVKGSSSYEAATGILKKNDSTSDIKGTLGIMGQSAPMAMTITATTTAKKL
jgi:hypothetical protein